MEEQEQKRVSFKSDEKEIKTFASDANEKLEKKRYLQGITDELKKLSQRSPTDFLCVQHLGSWMSQYQIYDFEDLELRKDKLNPTEYKVMWLCLSSKTNPKSISNHDFKFLQDFARTIRDKRKAEIKERTKQANTELEKDLEELEKIIKEREERKEKEKERRKQEEQQREIQEQQREAERQHYNRTTWFGVEEMDTSDDMIDFTNIHDDDRDGDSDGESDGENEKSNLKRFKWGGGGRGGGRGGEDRGQVANKCNLTLVDTALFTMLLGVYMFF